MSARTRPAGPSGSVETYPGGPRALARELGLKFRSGHATYGDLADAAAEAYQAKRAKRA